MWLLAKIVFFSIALVTALGIYVGRGRTAGY